MLHGIIQKLKQVNKLFSRNKVLEEKIQILEGNRDDLYDRISEIWSRIGAIESKIIPHTQTEDLKASIISVQKRQFLELKDELKFSDIDKKFRESGDVLFIQDKNLGIVTYGDYIRLLYEGFNSDNDISCIIRHDFEYLYESKLNEIEKIFNEKNLFIILILNDNDTPIYVIQKSNFPLNQSFYCKCLSGLSNYNFSINADLSVSCNCRSREAGELGNLNTETLKEIFNSPSANRIRKNLSNGILFSNTCLYCSELTAAPKILCDYYATNFKFPSGLMLENTSFCNLKCKYCYNEVIKKSTINISDFEMIAMQLAANNVTNISLFKYGEPFSDKGLGNKLTILRNYLPKVKIKISTNGMLISFDEMLQAAMLSDQLTFSLDGVDDETVTKFQKGSNFSTVFENMSRIIKTRGTEKKNTPIVTWKLVLFKWNDTDDVIKTAFQKANSIGIDKLEFATGWGIKPEEVTTAISTSKLFLEFMKKYNFAYLPGATPVIEFDLSNKKEEHIG